jgi:hypothetical protein
MKTVYIAMSADLITPNHVSIIQEASVDYSRVSKVFP